MSDTIPRQLAGRYTQAVERQNELTALSDPTRECAALLVETVPLLTLNLRAEMRARGQGLAMLQFQTLAFLHHRPGSSLSEVAEHLGLTLASTSKKVDGLVGQGLIVREVSPDDRRRVVLNLSVRGGEMLEVAWQGTRESFAARLTATSPADLAAVARALRVLRRAFAHRPADGLVARAPSVWEGPMDTDERELGGEDG